MGGAFNRMCACSCTEKKNENDDKEEIESSIPPKEITKFKSSRTDRSTSFPDMCNIL